MIKQSMLTIFMALVMAACAVQEPRQAQVAASLLRLS